MRNWMRVVMAAAMLLAGAGQHILAHAGHDHKVMGTVTGVAADHVVVKDTAGKAVTVKIAKATKIVRGKESLTATDITVGTRVVITALQVKDTMTAKAIELGAAGAVAAK